MQKRQLSLKDLKDFTPEVTANDLLIQAGKELQPGIYKTYRNGQSKAVHLVSVKSDVVTLKDDLERKDSYTMALAKFVKFYKHVA